MSTDRQKLQDALVRSLTAQASLSEVRATRFAEDLQTNTALEELHRAGVLRKLAYEVEQMTEEQFSSWLD